MSLEKAMTGDLTLKRGQRYLHSRYNPRKEAHQQVARMDIKANSICLCIEPLLGYVLNELEQLLGPKGRILIMDLDEECMQFRAEHLPRYSHCADLSFWPSFLQLHIHELNMDRVQIIRFPQSEKLYPTEYKELLGVWKQHLNRLKQNRLNSRYMGQARIRNSIKNLKNTHIWMDFEQKEAGDVLLIAPGPSLSNHLTEIKEYASKLNIFALSSAVAFLQHHKIPVDAVFTSDPGYWAALHYPFIPKDCPIIMPLSAKPPTATPLCSIVPVKEDNFLSQIVLSEDCTTVPEFGTVAASALYWLSRKVKGKIFIAGLDLSHEGILSHAKPYSFDSLIYSKSDRLQPLHQQYYHRHYLQDPEKNNSGPLSIYLEWFMKNHYLFKDKIVSITPSPLPISKAESHYLKGNRSRGKWTLRETSINKTLCNDFIKKLESQTMELYSHPPEEWNPNRSLEDFYYQLHAEKILDYGMDVDCIREQLPKWMDQIKEQLHECME